MDFQIGTEFGLDDYTDAYNYVSAHNYTIEEIPDSNPRRFKVIEIVTPPEEIAEMRIMELKSNLRETDYLVQKHVEGVLGDAEWEEAKVKRQAWRDEINALQALDPESDFELD